MELPNTCNNKMKLTVAAASAFAPFTKTFQLLIVMNVKTCLIWNESGYDLE